MPVYTKESTAGATVAAMADSATSQQGANTSNVQVAIVRVDNKGNMYQKTFTYDPKHFTSTAYTPFDPSNVAATASPASAASSTVIAAAVANSTDSKSMSASLASPVPAASIKTPSTPPAAGPPTAGPPTAAASAPATAAVPNPTAPVATSNSSSSNSSAAVKSSPAVSPPAAAPAAPRMSPSPTAAAPAPSTAVTKGPPLASPAASQPRSPVPAPAAPTAAPTAPARAAAASNSTAAPPVQQSKGADNTAAADSGGLASAGPGSAVAKTASPPAAEPDGSDTFTMVVWSSNSNSSGGEVLKPELGSYGSSAHDAADSNASAADVNGTAGTPAAVSNASSGADTANGTVTYHTVVKEPIVTVEGNESAPGGTVTTVTFGNDVQESGSPTPRVDSPAVVPVTPAQPILEPSCSTTQQVCTDKVTASSRYFGTKPSAAKYMDQVPMVGKGRISGMVLYYNKTSKCLRGTQVMYNYVDHPTSYYTSVLLGNSVTKSSHVVVKTLMLGKNESIVKAEVYAPKCVQYVKLFTSHSNTVLAGTVDPNATLFTPAANKPGGMLVAIRGFQDKAVSKSATATMPATTVPGVLKQLQFIWGARVCNCSNTAVAALAPPPVTLPVERARVSTVPSSSGRRLAQILQRAAVSSSVVLDSDELEQLQLQRRQEWQRQRQLHKIWRRRQLSDAPALAMAGSSDEPPITGLPWDMASKKPSSPGDIGSEPVTFASILARATMGLDGNLPAYDGPSIHRMLSVIAPDSRLPCPVLQYPYNTLGQINAKAQDGGFVCSGGLIGPDRVLTAGHCVWDDRDTQGPFEDLAFAPAQWKRDRKITAPLGKVDWDYVTLFEAYINDPDGEGLAYDIAVITLSKPVGQQLGYLGVRADTSPCSTESLSLTLAGYPGDDPEYPIPGGWQGGCFYDVCQVNFSCSVSITNHTCDSYVGQSGAPMYDKQNFVRAVHTLGVLPGFSTSNGAITIQKFILDNIMGYWKETSGFTPAAPGSIGSGSNYY
eukprot:GHUV01012551.1.p1 GENE.GHUV01012551.1~~GHUV01012551.1.p1  ORF type:complete len:1001 (+),score=340.54 GHUV01012551.1:455-3457(+)